MSNKFSRSAFERIASPEAVAEFDRSHGLTIAVCGSKCDHDWTGPEVVIENGSSASCAKCGALAISEDAKS